VKLLYTTFLVATLSVPAVAHHSISKSFDENKTTTLHGVITKIEWANPHVNLSMDVKDVNGAVTKWKISLAAPNALYRDGIRPEMFDVMKTSSAVIWPARDGSSFGTGRTLTSADGRILDVHDKWGDGEPKVPR